MHAIWKNRLMRISESFVVPSSPDRIIAALLSQELAAERAHRLGIQDFTHTVSGTTAQTSLTVPPSALPAQAQRFIRSSVSVRIDAAAQANQVSYTTRITGAPVALSSTVHLSSAGANAVPSIPAPTGAAGATVYDVVADLTVSVPFVGKKIEAAAASHARQALVEDCALVAKVAAR